MNDKVTTKSVGRDFAEVEEDFILDQSAMSKLVFRAGIHSKGIRGRIIRQRRLTLSDNWNDDKAINIRDLKPGEGFNIELDTNAVKEFFLAISKLATILKQRGVVYGQNEFILADVAALIVTDVNKAGYIKQILNAGYESEVWEQLVNDSPDLVTRLSYARVQQGKINIVEEFRDRLQNGQFHEAIGDDSWQKWIFTNNWIFGVNYQEPIEKAKINIKGIMPDYLFPTLDGFADILEIKLPKDAVIIEDSSHKGSWKWTAETNIAFGQTVNYLIEIDRLRFEIEQVIKKELNIEMLLLKPRAYILIGDSKDWTTSKKEGLRKLNSALNNITIITYRDLLDRAEHAVGLSKDTQDSSVIDSDDLPF